MVNGDVLRALFKGFADRDPGVFQSAAAEIIREERAKNHRLLADDLERLLLSPAVGRKSAASFSETSPTPPRDKERDFSLIDISHPNYDWDRIVLAPKTLSILQLVAQENRRRDILSAAALRPTQRLLFYGPPGCGKSLAAGALAGVLGIPLATVRFDAVVSSYLGETAANLRRVFEFISRGTYVVLFDEFDAIGKDRDDPVEHGELKRVVNSLLQLMDSSRTSSILVAATNHEQLLDSAIWRRFEAVVEFQPPTQQERLLLLRLFLRGFADVRFPLQIITRSLNGATGADIERVCVAAARIAILEGRSRVIVQDFQAPLSDFQNRRALDRTLRSPAGRTSKPENRTRR
jgi:SpoVK/Ycf46/Vps4 family AAA+-type ATPase